MNESAVGFADFTYQSRLRALKGVDEIVEDVIASLEEKGLLDNTYGMSNIMMQRAAIELANRLSTVIYTSDNGYHVGQHRGPAGKSLYFAEDTNLPFIVRGPNVPKNVTSKIPSLHLDLAPTFLDIAGVPESEWPEFFDGRSLLDQWHRPRRETHQGAGQGNGKESINVEYWGKTGIEAPSGGPIGSPFDNTTYKSIRTLGEDQSWLYTKWCSGDAELYNTTADRYELRNLVPAGSHKRIEDRLNALLMVTKSCEQGSCRDPWSLIVPPDGARLTSLTQALNDDYDDFFAGFARVSFNQCLAFQDASNEGPFFPELQNDFSGLGRAHRKPTSGVAPTWGTQKIIDSQRYGTIDQRHSTIEEIRASARQLTEEELSR